MKIRISGIFAKTLAVIIVAVLGGTLLPMILSGPSTAPEEDAAKIMPAFDDVNEGNKAVIEYVYVNDLIAADSETHFGVDEPVSISELAYAVVGLYENQEFILRSYEEYDAENTEYTVKAAEYGIWFDTEKTVDEFITRAEAAAVLIPFSSDITPKEDFTGFVGMENNAYAQQAIELYNRGISLETRLASAYSTDLLLTKGELAKLINMLVSSNMRISEFMPDYYALETELKNMMRAYQGDWSLYYEDYESGDIISINSHQVYSASLIKLFVMQTVYTRIDKGSLQETEHVKNLLYKMITVSDNDAWKELAILLGNGSYMAGMRSVTTVANEAGFPQTGQFMQGSRKNFNFTSVDDCGLYLHKVLDGEIIAPEYSEKILELLKQQQIKIKIPAGIPEGVTVANKTGELDYMQGDAAIVYAPSGTYILVIIGDSLENSGIAQEQIRNLSAYIYNYLNP